MNNAILKRKLHYIPEFDGVRGFFSLILISHHIPLSMIRIPYGFGWIGLQMFFVMSGYLISMLLLIDKEKEYSFGKLIKNFYARRAFRIFPLYFSFLLFWLFLSLLFAHSKNDHLQNIFLEFKYNAKFLFTYTYNLKDIINFNLGQNFRISPMFAPLWSLSLEEQFYLIIPFLVYFLSEKNLKRVLITIIIISPFIRIFGVSYLNGYFPENSTVPGYEKKFIISWIIHHHTIFQLDSLCIGTLIPLVNWSRFKKYLQPVFWSLLVLYFILTFSVTYLIMQRDILSFREAMTEPYYMTEYGQPFYIYTLVNVLSALFLIMVLENVRRFSIFSKPFFVELGKISYGMYILQTTVILFFFIIANQFFSQTQIGESMILQIVYFILIWLLIMGAGKFSFKYFESYFLKFKKRFT